MYKLVSVIIVISSTISVYSQKPNWQNLDLQKDSVFGISTDKAYKKLLKDKKPTQVIVAVIDSGIDPVHEDLKPVIWTNLSEIAGNGKDDDNNGYIDDRQGWNFIGSETGKEDVTYLATQKKNFYDSLSYTLVPENYRAGYQAYRKITDEYNWHLQHLRSFITELEQYKKIFDNIIQ